MTQQSIFQVFILLAIPVTVLGPGEKTLSYCMNPVHWCDLKMFSGAKVHNGRVRAHCPLVGLFRNIAEF